MAPRVPSGAIKVDFAQQWATPIAVGIACVGVIVLLALFSMIALSPEYMRGSGYDFNAYYTAAQRFLSTGSPYQDLTLGGPFRPGPGGLYLYAPPLALLFAPITALPHDSAMLLWFGLRICLFGLTCALMPVPRNVRLSVFGVGALSYPVLHDLVLGNVSLVVTFLGVAMWRWLDRPVGSVALAVSLTLRPTMALFLPWWLLRGRWRPVAWTLIALGVLVVATLPFVAFPVLLDYITVLRNVTGMTGVPYNVDPGSAVLLLGGPDWLATLALISAYLVAVTAAVWSLRRDRELSFVVTFMATLLLSPLIWDHYLTHLIVPAAFLAARGRPWGVLLPLLGWLPPPALPMAALVAMLVPFIVPNRGEPSGTVLRLLRRPASIGEV